MKFPISITGGTLLAAAASVILAVFLLMSKSGSSGVSPPPSSFPTASAERPGSVIRRTQSGSVAIDASESPVAPIMTSTEPLPEFLNVIEQQRFMRTPSAVHPHQSRRLWNPAPVVGAVPQANPVWPASMVEMPGIELPATTATGLDALASDFSQTLSDHSATSSSPQYRQQFLSEAEKNDLLFKARYGAQLWHAHHIQAQHSLGAATTPARENNR